MAQAFLRDTFNKTFSLSGVRKLLNRLGFSFHKASVAAHNICNEFEVPAILISGP